ncbi:flagellar cap protein FliD N-terminal domain-containing protein [Fusibacter sp. JL216-2]|uniref:flagellar cap protein FliD N-terminal domain-containing protein n=1 Tax=Fusibacter sp. JL216-2 TaxID=3071453 RepID=UPI003D328CC5
MIQGIYAYNSIYSLLNISRRDLRNTSTSPASIATSMLFGSNLNKTYDKLINYDAYEEQASFYDTFKSKLSGLKNAAQELSNPDSPAFETREAEFDSPAVSVTVEDGAQLEDYTIEVEQVATTQENKTEFVPANEANELSDALNHISITIDGDENDLLIERSPEETNQALYTNIAKTINESGLDVIARLVTDDSEQISLSVTSKESGEDSGFSIGGNLGEALNLDTVGTAPQDAIIRVDDDIIESSTNLVELDNGKLAIKINEETSIPFDLHIDVSGRGALAVAKRFGNSFSEAMIYLEGLNSVSADLLSKQLERAVTDNEDAFAELGITLNDNKKIEIDEKQFQAKFDENDREATKILTGFKGAVNQVERKVTEALRTPPTTFRPAPTLPANIRPYNFSYNQNSRPVPVNSLFTSGSIIDVFF